MSLRISLVCTFVPLSPCPKIKHNPNLILVSFDLDEEQEDEEEMDDGGAGDDDVIYEDEVGEGGVPGLHRLNLNGSGEGPGNNRNEPRPGQFDDAEDADGDE